MGSGRPAGEDLVAETLFREIIDPSRAFIKSPGRNGDMHRPAFGMNRRPGYKLNIRQAEAGEPVYCRNGIPYRDAIIIHAMPEQHF